MKRFTAIALAILLAIALCGCTPAGQTAQTYRNMHMDTSVELTAYGDNAQKLLVKCEQELSRLEITLSAYKNGGDIYTLNQANGEWCAVSTNAFELIEYSLEIAELTNGAFDPTILPAMEAWGNMSGEALPSKDTLAAIKPLVNYKTVELDTQNCAVKLAVGQKLDLGGIAKGYVANRLNTLYMEHGCSGIINLGGNIYACGTKPSGSAWRIGIQHPRNNENAGVVELTSESAVTSGDYQRFFERDGIRYHHILDPATLLPARTGIAGITVFSTDSAQADALSTACFVMGTDKADALLKSLGLRAFAILEAGEQLWLGSYE